MKFFFFALGFLISSHTLAAPDAVLEELRISLEDTKKKLIESQKQLQALENNDAKAKGALEKIEQSVVQKQADQKEAESLRADFAKKINYAAQAKRDFEKSVHKDREELGLVDKDIGAVEKRIVALQAARKALQENIEIAEENLGKMDDRSSAWQKNLDRLDEDLDSIKKDASVLEKKRQEQLAAQSDNQAALQRLRRSIQSIETNLTKYELRLKSSVRESERKAASRN